MTESKRVLRSKFKTVVKGSKGDKAKDVLNDQKKR